MQPPGKPSHALKAGGAAPSPGPVAKAVPVGPIAVPSSHHRASHSKSGSPNETAPSSKPAYTVAEVLRKTKSLLQPKSAIEHQFYQDCYQACHAMSVPGSGSEPPPPATVGGSSGANSPGMSSPTSDRPPAGAQGGAQALACPSHPSSDPPEGYISSAPEVALRLSKLGYRVVVRRVVDAKQYWSKSMVNTFCYCIVPGTGVGYVVDPAFKDLFKTGHMTERFRDIWECLPPLFVGPPAQLIPLVQLLCYEMGATFEQGGRQLPPWRSFSTVINRWMSPAFHDIVAPDAAAAGRDPPAVAQFLQSCAAMMSASPTAAAGAAAAQSYACADSQGDEGPAGRSAASSTAAAPSPAAGAEARRQQQQQEEGQRQQREEGPAGPRQQAAALAPAAAPWAPSDCGVARAPMVRLSGFDAPCSSEYSPPSHQQQHSRPVSASRRAPHSEGSGPPAAVQWPAALRAHSNTGSCGRAHGSEGDGGGAGSPTGVGEGTGGRAHPGSARGMRELAAARGTAASGGGGGPGPSPGPGPPAAAAWSPGAGPLAGGKAAAHHGRSSLLSQALKGA